MRDLSGNGLNGIDLTVHQGEILGIYGLVTQGDSELYRRALGININLVWGGVLAVFGLAMLIPALMDKSKPE